MRHDEDDGGSEIRDAEVDAGERRVDGPSADRALSVVREFVREELRAALPELPVEFVELDYHRGTRPFFAVQIPKEGTPERAAEEWRDPADEVARQVVDAAIDDMITAATEEARFTVRIKHHNSQLNFVLSFVPEEDDEEPRGASREREGRGGPSREIVVDRSRALGPPNGAAWEQKDTLEVMTEAFRDQNEHVRGMLDLTLGGTREREAAYRDEIKELRAENRLLRAERHQVAEMRNDLVDRRGEREAEARRQDYTAKLHEKTWTQLAGLLPMVGMMVFGHLQSKIDPAAGAPPGVVESAVRGFFSTIDEPQWATLRATGSIQFRDDQVSALQVMLAAMNNAQRQQPANGAAHARGGTS